MICCGSLPEEGAEYIRTENPADISRGLQCLRQELRETLPLLLLQVIAAFDAGAALQLPAAVVSDTAGAVGSFCRLFVASEFASWAAVALPPVVFGSPGDSSSTAAVVDSLALVLLQCLRPLRAALDSSSSGSFDAGAVAE